MNRDLALVAGSFYCSYLSTATGTILTDTRPTSYRQSTKRPHDFTPEMESAAT